MINTYNQVSKTEAIKLITGKTQNAPTASEIIKKDLNGNDTLLIFFNINSENFHKRQNYYENKIIDLNNFVWLTKPYKNINNSAVLNHIMDRKPIHIYIRTDESKKKYFNIGRVNHFFLENPLPSESAKIQFSTSGFSSETSVDFSLFLSKNSDVNGLNAEKWVHEKLSENFNSLIDKIDNLSEAYDVKLMRTVNKKSPYDILVNNTHKVEVKYSVDIKSFQLTEKEMETQAEENSCIILVNQEENRFSVINDLKDMSILSERKIYTCKSNLK